MKLNGAGHNPISVGFCPESSRTGRTREVELLGGPKESAGLRRSEHRINQATIEQHTGEDKENVINRVLGTEGER